MSFCCLALHHGIMAWEKVEPENKDGRPNCEVSPCSIPLPLPLMRHFSLRFWPHIVTMFVTFHRRRTSLRSRRESFWLGKWQNCAPDLVGPGHICCAVDLIQARRMSVGIRQRVMRSQSSLSRVSIYRVRTEELHGSE